jgi:hypothetical protein
MPTYQIPDQIKKPTPLYAVVGAGEAVVERIRDIDPKQLQAQAKEFPTKAQAKATEAQAKATERFSTVVDDVKHLPEHLRTLPERAQSVALQAFEQAGDVYADLAQRGEGVVQRVRNQGPVVGETDTDSPAKKPTKSTATKAKSSASSRKSGSRTKKSTDASA